MATVHPSGSTPPTGVGLLNSHDNVTPSAGARRSSPLLRDEAASGIFGRTETTALEAGNMTFKEAAREVLKVASSPLHAHEIARRALDRGLLSTTGKTPVATMEAALCIAARAPDGEFVRTAPRTFGLRQAGVTAVVAPLPGVDAENGASRVKVPHFPLYAEVRAFLSAVVGRRAAEVTHLRTTLSDLRGTPQANEDWSDPASWIPARLQGADRDVALAIWKGSGERVNPRHTTGVWLLCRNYALLDEAFDGRLSISERGQAWSTSAVGTVVREVDDGEGVLALLRIVADTGPATSGELLPLWRDYLQRNSKIRSDAAARSYLYQRLRNLLDRTYVVRGGLNYSVTPAGLAWLGGDEPGEAAGNDADAEIRSLVQRKQEQVKEALREILAEMDPYAFEHVIKDLLVEMGYVDVEVTAPSNDKGIDVIGRIQLGITAVKEVIQVKRHKRTVQRKDLDALRGCLHRFQAVRGTLITTSQFSSGTEKAAFEFGAAPITLIDGEKLIDLLANYGIGVKKRTIDVWDLDESAFGGEEA